MEHYFLTLINGGGPLCTIQRLKAKCDEALSSLALKFNLRRYTKGLVASSLAILVSALVTFAAAPKLTPWALEFVKGFTVMAATGCVAVADSASGRGIRSFTLELNLSTSMTHS
jgi:hypothetical protein